jgi:hypothetical protein
LKEKIACSDLKHFGDATKHVVAWLIAVLDEPDHRRRAVGGSGEALLRESDCFPVGAETTT